MMNSTTLKIREDTKGELDRFREHRNETYDDVIRKVLYIAKTAKTNPKLSKETVAQIEQARKRLKAGKFLTEDEARKRLGL
jgi:predicted transcriptional regulator